MVAILLPVSVSCETSRQDLAKIRVGKDGNFKYWQEDSPAIVRLKTFVAQVTDPASKDFVPERDRIATFDVDGTLLYVDNGASFDFRARGKRKGWFWKRMDVKDRAIGYLSLANHHDQVTLREILDAGSVTGLRLWREAKKYDFVSLVEQLPADYQGHFLLAYSKSLMETAQLM